jgi:hypothetical protein
MTLLHPNTKICTLSVTLSDATTETQVEKALALIANRCDQSTLTSLKFFFDFPPTPSGHQILHFNMPRPLLKFRNIQRLVFPSEGVEIGTNCMFDDIDDDALQVMSSAWPHLTHFGLNITGFKITLQGFLAFLKGSPNLEHVQLTADFDPSSLKCELDELPQYPKMKILHVQDSILKDARRTYDLFCVLFPALESIDCNQWSEYFDGWMIVNRLKYRESADVAMVEGGMLSFC